MKVLSYPSPANSSCVGRGHTAGDPDVFACYRFEESAPGSFPLIADGGPSGYHLNCVRDPSLAAGDEAYLPFITNSRFEGLGAVIVNQFARWFDPTWGHYATAAGGVTADGCFARGDGRNSIDVAWTVEAWIRPETVSARQVLLAYASGTGAQLLVTIEADGTLAMQWDDTPSMQVRSSTAALEAGRWQHIALRRTALVDPDVSFDHGTEFHFFVDGVEHATEVYERVGPSWVSKGSVILANDTNADGVITGAEVFDGLSFHPTSFVGSQWFLGSVPASIPTLDPAAAFHGGIKDVRVMDFVMSGATIAADARRSNQRHSFGVGAPISELVAHWQMDERPDALDEGPFGFHMSPAEPHLPAPVNTPISDFEFGGSREYGEDAPSGLNAIQITPKRSEWDDFWHGSAQHPQFNGEWTVSCWMRLRDNGRTDRYSVSFAHPSLGTSGTAFGHVLRIHELNGQINAHFQAGGSGVHFWGPTTTLNDFTRRRAHVAVRRKKSGSQFEFQVFVDGVPGAPIIDDGQDPLVDATSPEYLLQLGAPRANDDTTFSMDGRLYELTFHRVALDDGRIADLCARGLGPSSAPCSSETCPTLASIERVGGGSLALTPDGAVVTLRILGERFEAGDQLILKRANGLALWLGTIDTTDGTSHDFTVDPGALAPGSYTLRLQREGEPGCGDELVAALSVDDCPVVVSVRDVVSGSLPVYTPGTTPTVFIRGTGFAVNDTIELVDAAGSVAWSTPVTSTDGELISITLTIPSTPGTYELRVSRGGDCFGSFVGVTARTCPSVTSISPTTLPGSSGAQTLTVNGADFAVGDVVQVSNGSGDKDIVVTATSLVSSTQLSLSINVDDLPGGGDAYDIRVQRGADPGCGGTLVDALTLSCPTISAVVEEANASNTNPASFAAGFGKVTLAIQGTGFREGALIYLVDGSAADHLVAEATVANQNYISSSLIEFKLDTDVFGPDTYHVRVERRGDPACSDLETSSVRVLDCAVVSYTDAFEPTDPLHDPASAVQLDRDAPVDFFIHGTGLSASDSFELVDASGTGAPTLLSTMTLLQADGGGTRVKVRVDSDISSVAVGFYDIRVSRTGCTTTVFDATVEVIDPVPL